MIRSAADDLSFSSISLDEYCWRMAQVALRELKPLTELLHMVKANAPGSYAYPSVEELEHKLLGIYHSAFSRVSPQLLTIPRAAHPQLVVDFLKSHGWLPS